MRAFRVKHRMVVFTRTISWLGNNLEDQRFAFLMCCQPGFGEFSTELADEKAKEISTRTSFLNF